MQHSQYPDGGMIQEAQSWRQKEQVKKGQIFYQKKRVKLLNAKSVKMENKEGKETFTVNATNG